MKVDDIRNNNNNNNNELMGIIMKGVRNKN